MKLFLILIMLIKSNSLNFGTPLFFVDMNNFFAVLKISLQDTDTEMIVMKEALLISFLKKVHYNT